MRPPCLRNLGPVPPPAHVVEGVRFQAQIFGGLGDGEKRRTGWSGHGLMASRWDLARRCRMFWWLWSGEHASCEKPPRPATGDGRKGQGFPGRNWLGELKQGRTAWGVRCGAAYFCSINKRYRPLRRAMPVFSARRMRSFSKGSAFFHAALAVSAPAMTTATSW